MRSLTAVIFKNSKRKDEKLGNSFGEGILSAFSFFIVFSFLSIVMIIASIYVTVKLDKFDQTYAFVNLLLLMNFFILFTKSVFESLNVLYFSKDLKILLRMPIKPRDLLSSKIFNMIISEYSMEIIMLAIPIIVYGIYTKVSMLFYLYMLGILLVLPTIPIMVTSLIISIVMRFTNIIKNKNKVMYITIVSTVLCVTIFTAFMNKSNVDITVSGFESIVLKANGLAEAIADYFILIKPIMNILLNYNNLNGFINFIIYLFQNCIIYIVILHIMSKIYLKGVIGTIINSNKENRRNKPLTEKEFRKRSQGKSFLRKECKILSRIPIFCIQCLIMPIIYPIVVFLFMALFMSFASKVGVDVIADFYKRLHQTIGLALFISIGQVFYMMNFSSIIAVSKESKNSILVKYLPLSLKKQFNLKIKIGVLLNSIASVLVTYCYYICVKNILYTLIIFIILIFLNLIGEKIKLLIDLKNPKITWDNEYTMMKQNMNVMYELFYTMLVILILAMLSFMIKSVAIYLDVVLFIVIIVNFFINEYVYKKQDYLFRKVF